MGPFCINSGRLFFMEKIGNKRVVLHQLHGRGEKGQFLLENDTVL